MARETLHSFYFLKVIQRVKTFERSGAAVGELSLDPGKAICTLIPLLKVPQSTVEKTVWELQIKGGEFVCARKFSQNNKTECLCDWDRKVKKHLNN